MADLRIDWTGLTEFQTGLRNAPRILDDELGKAARTIAHQGEALSKVYAPVFTGAARNSVYARTQVGGGSASAIFGASSEHAWYADQGRGPGKMPPQGALVGWHGVTEAEEFVVRRAIGRRGTKGKPFVTRAFKEISQGFAQSEIGKALSRALARIGGH